MAGYAAGVPISRGSSRWQGSWNSWRHPDPHEYGRQHFLCRRRIADAGCAVRVDHAAAAPAAAVGEQPRSGGRVCVCLRRRGAGLVAAVAGVADSAHRTMGRAPRRHADRGGGVAGLARQRAAHDRTRDRGVRGLPARRQRHHHSCALELGAVARRCRRRPRQPGRHPRVPGGASGAGGPDGVPARRVDGWRAGACRWTTAISDHRVDVSRGRVRVRSRPHARRARRRTPRERRPAVRRARDHRRGHYPHLHPRRADHDGHQSRAGRRTASAAPGWRRHGHPRLSGGRDRAAGGRLAIRVVDVAAIDERRAGVVVPRDGGRARRG